MYLLSVLQTRLLSKVNMLTYISHSWPGSWFVSAITWANCSDTDCDVNCMAWVFWVKGLKLYFSMGPLGVHKKFGLGTIDNILPMYSVIKYLAAYFYQYYSRRYSLWRMHAQDDQDTGWALLSRAGKLLLLQLHLVWTIVSTERDHYDWGRMNFGPCY